MVNSQTILFFFMFISFISCKAEVKTDELDLFKAKTYLALHNSFKLDILNPEFLNNEEAIDKPVLTWQKLLRFSSYDESLAHPNDYCLFYLVPKATGKITYKGILKLVKIETSESCDQVYVREGHAQLDDLDELQVYFETDRKYLQRESYQLSPYILVFKLKKSDKTDWVEIPIYNVARGDVLFRSESHPSRHSYHHAKFSAGIKETLIPSITVLGVFDKPNAPTANWNYFGSFDASYPERTTQVCHNVSVDCVSSGSLCQMCQFGSYEVVNSSCVVGNPRLCGPNRCGERGWPACPRGFSWENNIAKQACFDGSQAGFCRPGLKTVCDENKILICL